MSKISKNTRLRLIYFYTIIGAGGFGLGILFKPEWVTSMFKMPAQDPVIFSITGAVYLAFGFLSIWGLFRPVLASPVLLIQLIYKVIWLGAITTILFINGEFPFYAVLIAAIYLTYVVGDLWALPYAYLFTKKGSAVTRP